MKSFILCAALACGVTFASEAKTAVKPALATTETSHSNSLINSTKKAVLFQLDQPTVVEVTVCGHYTWVAYYNEAQKQERIDYLVDTYCN